jgi:hypothetical protein
VDAAANFGLKGENAFKQPLAESHPRGRGTSIRHSLGDVSEHITLIMLLLLKLHHARLC